MKKHNHRMATRPLRLHPFERQKLRAIWSERTVNAGIHSLMADDVEDVVAKVGTLLYVVLGAAQMEDLDAEAPDMRILRAAANTLEDCAGAKAFTDLQRASLSSALEALKRTVATIPEETLLIAATHAKVRLAHGPVTVADFRVLAGIR